MTIRRWKSIHLAAEVTQEILDAAENIDNEWFLHQTQIDWDDFINRLDGLELEDGTKADLGNSSYSPAIQTIQNHIREYRKL